MATVMNATFFETPSDFRRWLERHHASASELWVGFHKKSSGQPSITSPESVDEALCFGWIDGIRKSLDANSYVIRFTPRRRGSIWSEVNVRRVKALKRERRMRPAGLNAFTERDPKKTSLYAYEQRHSAELSPEELKAFKSNKRAWDFFQSQPSGYRRLAAWFVVSARQPATRARRLTRLMTDSAAGQRLGPMRRQTQE
jgi:uncharacterized protein YdeI (YjbR/CyaY-like superfamily)